MSTRARSFAACGLLFAALAAVRCYALPGSNAAGRLFFPLCLLALGGLALLLLRREGCDKEVLACMLLPIGLALLFRAFLLPHATLDYQDFLSKWVEHFRLSGGFLAVKDQVGNYNVPYLYMLAFLSYLPVSDLYGIKLFSILFDVLLSWGGFRLIRCLTSDKRAPLIGFSVLLLLPTVVLNGACWGQCDSVWGALCVLALACALEGKPIRSAALLGLAFSFKLQAIFLIPLWLVLWLGKKVKFTHLFALPAAFLASILPALLLGKPLSDILGVYLGQASDSIGWGTVNYNSPSFFALMPYGTQFAPWVPKAAILTAFLFMLLILALLLPCRDRLSNTAYTLGGTCLALGIPFFLPYMHERYFFLGGVLLVLCACARPIHAPAAGGAELASLGGYHAYLLRRYALYLTLFGIGFAQLIEGGLMLFALGSSVWALMAELKGELPTA